MDVSCQEIRTRVDGTESDKIYTKHQLRYRYPTEERRYHLALQRQGVYPKSELISVTGLYCQTITQYIN